jgi:TonB family protein
MGAMNSICTLLVFILLAAPNFLQSQETGIPSLSQEDIASHLMVWVAPVYPAIAQAARVQGDVVVTIEIAPNGLVRSTRVVSGPAMLRQTTADALKQCRYQPFHSGEAAIAVSGKVVVSFALHDKPEVHTSHESTANGSYSVNVTFPPPDDHGQPDEEIANRFDPLWEICSRDVIAHITSTEAAEACKKAAAIADEFPADRRFIEKRRVYVYAATAIANAHDLQGALPFADKAVVTVKLGHDDDSGSESAYSIRGQLRAFSGDMKGGDEDMSAAEDFARKIKNSGSLKKDLEFHAELLKRLNRPQEAQMKLDEAGKL